MGATRHTKVLSVLEKRTLQFRRKGQLTINQDKALLAEALDETLIVSTASLIDSDEESLGTTTSNTPIYTAAEATLLENEEIRGVNDKLLLTVHGVAPGPKPEGVTCMICENADGFNTRISNNEKLEKAKEIIDELEADIVAYSEHQINCSHKENVNGMGQMFNRGKSEIWSQTGHNVHENMGRRQ